MNAHLCRPCHRQLLHELQDSRTALVTQVSTQPIDLSDSRPHVSFVEHGPCEVNFAPASERLRQGLKTKRYTKTITKTKNTFLCKGITMIFRGLKTLLKKDLKLDDISQKYIPKKGKIKPINIRP